MKFFVTFLIIFSFIFPNVGYTADLNFSDLGFNKSATQSNPALQKKLEKRQFMLEQHQLWGLVTLGLLGATLVTAREGSARPEHIALGSMTAATYGVSAYYALAAPDRPSNEIKGGVKWHRYLAWVHGIGMIGAPILGYLAQKQVEKGQPIHGLAKQHKNFAGAAAIALAVSFLTVSFEF